MDNRVKSLDWLVFKIEEDKQFSKVKKGDFVIRSKNNKVISFLGWLCGN